MGMLLFSIQRGAKILSSWNVSSRELAVHDETPLYKGIPIIDETCNAAFVLNLDEEGLEYRISIGDIPIEELISVPDDAMGVVLGGQRFWRESNYFESARGTTLITLQSRLLNSKNAWQERLAVQIYVIPSKIGEKRFEEMGKNVQALSRSLLVDLYGKSRQTHDLRYACEGKNYVSPEQELASIEVVIEKISQMLLALSKRPASAIKARPKQIAYWGNGRLSPYTYRWLSSRGVRPCRDNLPLSVKINRSEVDFDISEHRILKWFLELLKKRATYCARVARAHISLIEEEKPMRNIRIDQGPTLYESIDIPRIKRLEEAAKKAANCGAIARGLSELYFLRSVNSNLNFVKGGIFERSDQYREILKVLRHFLLKQSVWSEGHRISAVTKLTSRLFEQWCLLQIVDAFRSAGLKLQEWDEALRGYVRSMFIIDFNRGLTFEGLLTSDLRIRIRYEPWILPEQTAHEQAESLCRGSHSAVAWCPDILIECMRKEATKWIPVYAIVMDCKYKLKLRDQDWNDTQKYFEIRRSIDMAQVVRQLWLIALTKVEADQRLVCEDPHIKFTETGVNCGAQDAVRLQMWISPSLEVGNTDATLYPFKLFAQGAVNYIRREFSPTFDR